MDEAKSLSHSKWECKFAGGWLHQGKERDPYREGLRRAQTQLRWAAFLRGYFVSTVGRDATVIREYIKHQETEDHRLEQLKLLS